MSKVIPLPAHSARLRIVQGLISWAAFGGLGACGTDEANEGPLGSRVSQASTESGETQVDGQSGTEYGGGGGSRPTCPCGSLRNPLRATVMEVVGHIEGADGFPVRMGNVRLRVEELLGSTTGIEIGSEISGGWFGALPCFYGCASVAVGDQVLAFYRFPMRCSDSGPDDGCPVSETIPAAITGITPWGDSVLLAELQSGDFTLAVEDLPHLDSSECMERLGNIADRLGPSDAETACYERESKAP